MPATIRWVRVAAVLLLVGLWTLTAHAADPDAPKQTIDIEKLLERLERVEKQNEELRQQLLDQQQLIQQHKAPAPAEEDTADPETAPLDGQQVRKLVDDYLKAKDEEKKYAEAARAESGIVNSEVGKDLKMGASWRNGVFLQSADKAFDFNVGGRVDYDNGWYAVNPALNESIGVFNNYVNPYQALEDGSDFRRARLRFQGSMWEVMEFNVEVDFANLIDLRRRALGIAPPANGPTRGDLEPSIGTRLTDCWMGFNDLPWVGTFRAGHMKEWITFTNETSGRFLTFLERPLLFDAFNNDFQFSNGFTWQRNWLNQRAYTWAGFFRTGTNIDASSIGDGDYAYDTKVTCLPVWLEDGLVWVHLGVDYSHRTLHLNRTDFRARPQVFAGSGFQVPNIVGTGQVFSKDAENLVNFEFASAWGRLTLTSEYCMVFLNNTFTGGLPAPNGQLPKGAVSRGDYFAQGWYVECLYFLTPDHRDYRRDQPSYDRIRPRENFFLVRGPGGKPICGLGAWEIGARYDYLDLINNGINGGVAHAVTLGLNWHLNPNMKVQWNYMWMERRFDEPLTAGTLPGSFDGLGMRFHWDF